MKVKIYPIHSALHNQIVLTESTTKFISELAKKGIDVSVVDTLDNFYTDCDLSLILVQSGGSENLFVENFAKFKEPYYLLTYGVNNSLAASLEIMAFLKNHNLKGEVIHGDNDYIAARLNELNVSEPSIKAEANLGIIGKPSDWLISSDVDKKVALEKFKVNLINIPISEVAEEYNKVANVNVDAHVKGAEFDAKEFDKAERLYNALDVIVKKYNLAGFTIRCFDLLTSLKTTSCLALSHFNDRGIIATCEGDVPSMLGMYTVKKVLNQACFQANPSRIDAKNDKLLIAHCTIPLTLCNEFHLDTHFESGIGVGIHGEVKTGEATIFRINSALTKCFVEEGTIDTNQYEGRLCRTQINCHFPELNKILTNPLGNHELIILGHHKDELVKYLNSIGIERI